MKKFERLVITIILVAFAVILLWVTWYFIGEFNKSALIVKQHNETIERLNSRVR